MYYYLTLFNSNKEVTHRYKSVNYMALIRMMMNHIGGFAFTTFPYDDESYWEYR